MIYRQAGTSAPYTNRQNLAFEWDLNGNLKKRIDVGQANLTEEFFYDALNRLDYSQLNGVTNLDLTLDAIGNITAKTSNTDPAENVGSYTYHATKKHAVVSTSNGWSFGYDANGNMTSYKGNSITWTSYNLPSSIAAAGQSSQFWYGPNRNRWKQLASYPSGSETTIYVGGVLEKVTVPTGTAWRHYLGAGSAKVVYTRWSTGSENTRYLTADHLNSSSVLMDSSGNTLVGMSFAAYGRRRGSAWTGAPSSGDWTQINNATRHGYTGHEHLDNVNLIHMNGRVFEPVLGRFLSADPFMPGSLGSQAPNRYAYVGNRPLSLTDPSGFAPPKQGFTLYLPILKNEPTPSVGQIMNQINQAIGNSEYLANYANMLIGLHPSAQVRSLQDRITRPSGGQLASAGTTVSTASTSPTSAAAGQSTTSTTSPAGGSTTMLEPILVTSTHTRPDLGGVGNLIRLQLDSPFEQFMFERYWLGQGAYRLTAAEFHRAVGSIAGESPQASEVVTSSDGQPLTRMAYQFPSGEFDAAFGTASLFFDSAGRAVGFFDFYNMNKQGTGDSWWRDFKVELVRDACAGHCAPFEITYGTFVRPTGP